MAKPVRRSASVSGNSPSPSPSPSPETLTSSVAVYRKSRRAAPTDDRREIAKRWQIDAYRHVNICGEARYAVALYAALASRAEIGVSKPQALNRKAVWVTEGTEVDALFELAPTVRERTKLIRDFMTHRTIAGECYLIARDRRSTDPDPTSKMPLWEIVAVTELRKRGTGDSEVWSVRYDNDNWIDLTTDNPVIRMWNPDPENRREAWSPFRSMLGTLREIEWLTLHIFTQVRSRMMSAGVWFLPENLTFPPPPTDSVEGGDEAIAAMNDAEKLMASLAASSMEMLDAEEVSFPSVVMADPLALAAVDQAKLIQFWSEIDDKAMTLRGDAVRRFALGMDLPPEQVLGSSGVAVSGSGGSAGSVNHWGEWASEEKTIAGHIEPALSDFVEALTSSFLRVAVEGTELVIGFDPASIRMKQDRSKEAMEWYDRGVLKADVALREGGFDPESDLMDADEWKRWILTKIATMASTPEQSNAAMKLMGVVLDIPELAESPDNTESGGAPGRALPPSLEDHPYQGPPRVDHEHNPAPFGTQEAAAEVLVLRALEKAGNRLLNDGKRGRDKDKTTPPHMAHLAHKAADMPEFDFSLSSTVFGDLSATQREEKERQMRQLCQDLYTSGSPYTRDTLIERFGGA